MPKSSARDPSALPLCGGVLGGINRPDTANVAVNNSELARELLSGGPSGNILLDFLEHRNPDRKLEFDRSPFRLPWTVRQDVKFVGSLDKIVGSFESNNSIEGEKSQQQEEEPVKLLTPTPRSLLKSLWDPPSQDDEDAKIVTPSNPKTKGRPLISEYDPSREAKPSKFENNLMKSGGKDDKSIQGETIKFCRPLTMDGAPIMSEVISRQIKNQEMKPLVGRAIEKDGVTFWVKIYFPPPTPGNSASNFPLKAKDLLIKMEQVKT